MIDLRADELSQRDLMHNWHPCSQQKDYESCAPLAIKSASGSYFTLSSGKPIIDAISSWWCKALGHGHPRLREALKEQMERFEHVIFAHTTHETIIQLSEKLATLSPGLGRVFYAGDGSSGVEIALKMSLHSRKIKGEKRHEFMALANGYHGETAGALSVSDVQSFRASYVDLTFPVEFIQNIPYVTGKEDPLWKDCSSYWTLVEAQLTPKAESLSAIILEPIVQGSAGMKFYSADFLKRLRKWCTENNVHLIADEIMTGLGRTGMPLACDHASITPDFLCLSKGLTSGWLPFTAIITSDDIYDVFYGVDYEKSFLHSHTHSGNALGASVALACLTVMEEENIYQGVRDKEILLQNLFREIAEKTGVLENVRVLGAIAAAEMKTKNHEKRIGYTLFQEAIALGAYLRPIGKTLYWCPPLNVSEKTLKDLQEITLQALTRVLL